MRRRTLLSLPLAAGVAAAAGCRDTGSDTGDRDPGLLREVTYLTSFGLSGRESYVYTGIKRGLFAAAGLAVTVQPGQGGPFNTEAINTGRAQFAAADCSNVMALYAKAQPAERGYRAVGAIHQRTLLSVVTLDDTIRTPTDLVGRRLAVGAGSAPIALWPLYARLAGVDPEAVTWQETKPDQVAGLLVADKVDGAGLFVAGLPQVQAAEDKAARDAGRPPRTARAIPYSDYIADLFGNLLLTSSRLVEEEPDLVRRFTGALMASVEAAVGDPQAAGQAHAEVDPTVAAAVSAAELTHMRPYCLPPAGQPFGHVEESRAARAVALMRSLPLPTLDPAELFALDLVPGVAR